MIFSNNWNQIKVDYKKDVNIFFFDPVEVKETLKYCWFKERTKREQSDI